MKKGVDRGREKQYTNQAVPREGLKKPVNPRERYGENSLCSLMDSGYQTEKTLLADEKSA